MRCSGCGRCVRRCGSLTRWGSWLSVGWGWWWRLGRTRRCRRSSGCARVVLVGRLSVQGLSWLGEHRVHGVVLLPGTGLLELALVAGAQTGCAVVEELTLTAPLVIPADGVAVQVVVGAPDPAGRRAV